MGGLDDMPMSPPRRAFELTIKIGGDTWRDVLRDLLDTARHVEQHGPQCNSVSGGYSTNHIVDVRVDPDMTHDRYVDQLEAYLAEQLAAECAPTLDHAQSPDRGEGPEGVTP